jgi:hypothetical protein
MLTDVLLGPSLHVNATCSIFGYSETRSTIGKYCPWRVSVCRNPPSYAPHRCFSRGGNSILEADSFWIVVARWQRLAPDRPEVSLPLFTLWKNNLH